MAMTRVPKKIVGLLNIDLSPCLRQLLISRGFTKK
jgi:hypothetical protein